MLLLWEVKVLILPLLLQIVLYKVLAVGEGQLDGNVGQIIEKLLSLLVGQVVVKLRINDTPEGTLLRDTRLVLAVEE